METESHNLAPHASKCEHGVYWSRADAVAWCCQQCNPDIPRDGDRPVLPRSSGDPLNSTRTAKNESCSNCGCVRTYFSNLCRACNTPFPASDIRGRFQGAANAVQSGNCPACGSNVHYETKTGTWQCADCDEVYSAPKRLR